MEVRLEGLRFERSGRTVLEVPELAVAAGRITVVLGPNGAGKSTLLRLMAALEAPSHGRVLHDGETARAGQATWRRLAFAFQRPALLQRSVRANLELGLRLRGLARAEVAQRVGEVSARLEITALLDRPADRISGGEAQRTNLARALALRAPLTLLDEPLSGIDPSARSRLLDELPDLLRAFASTVVLVTHDLDEAARLADELVVLVAGKVRAWGPGQAVLQRPPDAEVAELLGYRVLTAGGRQLAVPAGGLRLGPGEPGFELVVEGVRARPAGLELVGRIGGRRVELALPAGTPTPAERTCLSVAAERVVDLGPACPGG